MKRSLLTVLVPCYNQASYISQCLSSLNSQEERNFDIIVSDNHSTDDSSAQLMKYADTMNIVRPPRFLPATQHFNFLFSLVSTPWATLICGDDWVSPAYVTVLSNLARQYPSASLVRAGWKCIGSDGEVKAIRRLWSCPVVSTPPNNFHETIIGPKSPLIAWAANMELFREVGFFDENVDLCDWTAMISLSQKGAFVTRHKPIAFYRTDYRPDLQTTRIEKQLHDCFYIVNSYLLPRFSPRRSRRQSSEIRKLLFKLEQMIAYYGNTIGRDQVYAGFSNDLQVFRERLNSLI